MPNVIVKDRRYPEVSIARGIGIILVVIGHCIPDVFFIKQFIYLFHMPLFFFLSGYCYRVESEKNWVEYCIRKVRSLYIPFVLCNCFALLFHQIFCRIGLYPQAELFQSKKQFLVYFAKILLCIKMEDIVAPLWFLPILMVVSIANVLIRKILSQLKWNPIIFHILVLVLYCVVFLVPRTGVFRAYVLVTLGLFSYDLGYLVKSKLLFERANCWTALVAAAILVVAARHIDINMIQMRIGNPITYAFPSMLGIYSVWTLSKLLKKVRTAVVLNYIGTNSLTILEWHYYAFLVFTIFQSYLTNGKLLVGGLAFVWYYSDFWLYRCFCFLGYLLVGVFSPLSIKRCVQKCVKKLDERKCL